jgi:hypothetical protein
VVEVIDASALVARHVEARLVGREVVVLLVVACTVFRLEVARACVMCALCVPTATM